MENREKFKFGEELEYYPVQQDIRDNIAKIKMNDNQKVIYEYWDKLKEFIEWDSPETTVKHYSFKDYNELWNKCRKNNVVLRPEIKNENEKTCDIFNEYTMDELKKLYKSFTLFCVTEYMKSVKRYKGDVILELYVSDEKYNTRSYKRLQNSDVIDAIEYDLENGNYKNDNEKLSLGYKLTALKTFNEVLFWCAGGFTQLVEDYSNNKNFTNPQTLYDELHFSDDSDIKNNKATKWDIYLFIWNSLRYATYSDLVKLNKLADKQFIKRDRGRPTNNKKIIILDKFGEVIKIYNNRQECMEGEGIGKTMLSLLLSGQKRYRKQTYAELTDEEFKRNQEMFDNLKIQEN